MKLKAGEVTRTVRQPLRSLPIDCCRLDFADSRIAKSSTFPCFNETVFICPKIGDEAHKLFQNRDEHDKAAESTAAMEQLAAFFRSIVAGMK